MAELATIARPYAEALFKASGSDLGAAATWLDELAVIAANAQLQQFAGNPRVTAEQTFDVVSDLLGDIMNDPKYLKHKIGFVEPRKKKK